MIKQKLAVCGILFNEEGKVLTVSRKDNPLDLGLPGGKIEDTETTLHAMIREVKEETGLILSDNNYPVIYSDEDGEYFVHVYFLGLYVPRLHGSIQTTEAGIASFQPFKSLFNKSCSFHEFNTHLFKSSAKQLASYCMKLNISPVV